MIGRTISNPAYGYAPATGSTSYANNALNQVTAINAGAVTTDTRGNITSGVAGSFGYDAENNLTSAGGANYLYDPLGRLTVEGNATPRRFLYDGFQVVGEYPSGGGAIVNRYVPGAGLDDLAAYYTGSGTGTRHFPLADERLSVIGIADGSGTATVNAYDEYGTPAPGNTGRFQYTGQVWLADPGLQYSRMRTYAPGLGRFVQADPIGYQGGANLYAYVRADPINFVDPMGLECTAAQRLAAALRDSTCVDDVVVVGQRCPPGWTRHSLGYCQPPDRDFSRPGIETFLFPTRRGDGSTLVERSPNHISCFSANYGGTTVAPGTRVRARASPTTSATAQELGRGSNVWSQSRDSQGRYQSGYRESRNTASRGYNSRSTRGGGVMVPETVIVVTFESYTNSYPDEVVHVSSLFDTVVNLPNDVWYVNVGRGIPGEMTGGSVTVCEMP